MNGTRVIVFGKLPRHGDFISRGLDAPRRDAWDAWLSAAVERAKQTLGPDFPAAHDTAPPWRFVAGPGDFGADWRAGALAASVDSAGRRFAIMTAAEGLDESGAATLGEPIAEAAEAMIYRAFEDGWDADALASAVEGKIASARPATAAAPGERWWTFDRETGDPLSLGRAPASLFGVPA